MRWHIDHGFVVIPKSSDPERIAANFDVFGFALTADELARIDGLGRLNGTSRKSRVRLRSE